MISRRAVIKACCVLPLFAMSARSDDAFTTPSFSSLKDGYLQRLKNILAKGELPYIDIESSCNSSKLDVTGLADAMDRLNIGLMALSADPTKKQYKNGIYFDGLHKRLISQYPSMFIPTGDGGQPPFLSEKTDEFLSAQKSWIENREIMLLGEYEFHHYPSPRQVERGELDRDVNIAIDSEIGHKLFSLSEKSGTAFQIHYEVEDELLSPLEKMLTQYPKAKVIWCHLAQVRYIERASLYAPAYVDSLLKRFPNLYFDTAFGNYISIYPLSKQRHARIWTSDGRIKDEWLDLIVAHQSRFLSALDLGGDRMEQIIGYDKKHREFLSCLPVDVRHKVAYKNAWKLLFDEEFA